MFVAILNLFSIKVYYQFERMIIDILLKKLVYIRVVS